MKAASREAELKALTDSTDEHFKLTCSHQRGCWIMQVKWKSSNTALVQIQGLNDRWPTPGLLLSGGRLLLRAAIVEYNDGTTDHGPLKAQLEELKVSDGFRALAKSSQ